MTYIEPGASALVGSKLSRSDYQHRERMPPSSGHQRQGSNRPQRSTSASLLSNGKANSGLDSWHKVEDSNSGVTYFWTNANGQAGQNGKKSAGVAAFAANSSHLLTSNGYYNSSAANAYNNNNGNNNNNNNNYLNGAVQNGQFLKNGYATAPPLLMRNGNLVTRRTVPNGTKKEKKTGVRPSKSLLPLDNPLIWSVGKLFGFGFKFISFKVLREDYKKIWFGTIFSKKTLRCYV